MLEENRVRVEPPVRFLEKSSITVDCSLIADCLLSRCLLTLYDYSDCKKAYDKHRLARLEGICLKC